MRFYLVITMLARHHHFHCFLFGFALFFSRGVAAANVAAFLAAPAAPATPFLVAVVSVGYPQAFLLRAVKPVLFVIIT